MIMLGHPSERVLSLFIIALSLQFMEGTWMLYGGSLALWWMADKSYQYLIILHVDAACCLCYDLSKDLKMMARFIFELRKTRFLGVRDDESKILP